MTEITLSSLRMTLVVFGGFLFHWTAVLLEWKKVKPFSKAAAMILVIAWTFLSAHIASDVLLVILLLAQFFGLLGDVLLLFPAKWFVWGLGSFLVGHLFYLGLMIVFLGRGNQGNLLSDTNWVVVILGLVFWIIYLLLFTRFVSPYIYKTKEDLPFWRAVIVYGAILSFIVVFSTWISSRIPGFSWGQLCLPVGAALFFVSDNLLAYDRFVKPIRKARFWVIVTYHLGQFGLAAGFLDAIRLMA